ncbi:MAG TPA: inorganic phosphate transporter [Rhodanobacteraceae bacterium]
MTPGSLTLVIVAALAFTYINGFHDTANSIATVVATRVLSPFQAVLLAAITNLAGALLGSAVALTIATGLIDAGVVKVGAEVLSCALVGAIIWDLFTWRLGLPTSSTQALVGGLCGAALAASGGNLHAVIWATDVHRWWVGGGLIPKVVAPMIGSSIIGFVLGIAVMGALLALFAWFSSRRGWLRRLGRTPFVNALFGKAQLLSATAVGVAHGMNDAQKTMGIVALALADATTAHVFDHIPEWLHFLRVSDIGGHLTIPIWVKVLCALMMAAGTGAGGWRIIKTMGEKMVKLHPINGFAVETSTAAVIIAASIFGLPISTTQVVSPAIMGVGAAKRFNAVHWSVVQRMVWAWILTLPISAAVAWGLVAISRPLWH